MAQLPNPTKGIVRLDYETTAEGWNARYQREGVPFSQAFPDSKYGSPEASLAAAIEWRRHAEETLPPMNRREFAELKRSNNSSGVTGVYRSVSGYYNGKALYYWYAIWSPRKGKKASKAFSVQKFGDERAKQLAIEARQNAIANLDPEWPEDAWLTGRRQEIEDAFARDVFGFEGDERYVIHRQKERDRNLRQQKVDAFLAEHGDLFCEVCEFSFEKQYGLIGRGLIEIHHLVPLAEMTPNHKTTLEELICICSNCHLVIHNGDPTDNLKQLQFIFLARPKRKRKTNKAVNPSGGSRGN